MHIKIEKSDKGFCYYTEILGEWSEPSDYYQDIHEFVDDIQDDSSNNEVMFDDPYDFSYIEYVDEKGDCHEFDSIQAFLCGVREV